jgi:hypothetical protein
MMSTRILPGTFARQKVYFGDLQVSVVLYKVLEGCCFHPDTSTSVIFIQWTSTIYAPRN